jgi:hypothetical protein
LINFRFPDESAIACNAIACNVGGLQCDYLQCDRLQGGGLQCNCPQFISKMLQYIYQSSR